MALSENSQKVLDLIKELTVVEMNELVKAIEEEFWVSAAPVMVAWWTVAGWDSWWDEWEKDSVSVELAEVWQQKISVIKVIKELLWVWLKEAKEIVEKVPVAIKENIKMEEAEPIKAKLEEAWATVNLK